VSLATAAAIRNRVIALLEAITPTSLAGTPFRGYRNEGDADFEAWAGKNPSAAFRRVQVRQVGEEDPPLVSHVTEERVRLKLEARIAYPQTHRYGDKNGLSRDDVIAEDWLKINRAVGIYGRGNFSGTHDCTPLGAVKSREAAGPIDYLVVALEFEYVRSTT
jgi:hypothetical protein